MSKLNLTPAKFNSLEEVSNALNQKYSKISDFKTYVDYQTIKGGFYEMRYRCNLTDNGFVTYYFCETFAKITETLKTFDDVFKYADQTIQFQLVNQKYFDEKYATENNKPVQYKFDYSLIEA